MTAHDTIEGVIVALRLVENDANFMVVVGAGIRTDTGDVKGLLTNKGTKAKDSGDSVHEIEGRVPLWCCQTRAAVIYLLGMEIVARVDIIEGFSYRMKNTVLSYRA